MSLRSFFIPLLMGLLLHGSLSYGQPAPPPARSLTLLYGSNINGEIDPCPS